MLQINISLHILELIAKFYGKFYDVNSPYLEKIFRAGFAEWIGFN